MMHSPDLDSPIYPPADVAEVTGLAAKTVANWADRGLGNPYGGRQGHGNARLYSLRDLARFELVRRLSEAGVAIVAAIHMADRALGEDFSPARARYLALRHTPVEAHPGDAAPESAWTGTVRHLADARAVVQSLEQDPVRLIVKLDALFADVASRAARIRERKTTGGSKRN